MIMTTLVRDCCALLNANSASVLPGATQECLLKWLASSEGQNNIAMLHQWLKVLAIQVNDPLRVSSLTEAVLEAVFHEETLVTEAEASPVASHATWALVLQLLALPANEKKTTDVLEEAVAHGNCLVLFAYLRRKRKQCESLAQEQALLATLLDWFRHIKMRYVVHHYFCYRVHRYFVSCCFNQFVISIQHGEWHCFTYLLASVYFILILR